MMSARIRSSSRHSTCSSSSSIVSSASFMESLGFSGRDSWRDSESASVFGERLEVSIVGDEGNDGDDGDALVGDGSAEVVIAGGGEKMGLRSIIGGHRTSIYLQLPRRMTPM